jgi:hypothetical protein
MRKVARLLALARFLAVAAPQCEPRPVLIPIQNVTLPNGAQVRGVSLAVGSPLQNISMFASAYVTISTQEFQNSH